ncbi:MAG TPA: hypothetical protein VL443_26285 [Cyclobacteriaceae bacterium]|nr:hypothetical protein [Cyclobacteriaceae bacterium]
MIRTSMILRSFTKRFLLLLAAIAFSCFASGQSFKEKMQGVSKKYASVINLHMRMAIQVFDDGETSNATYSINADIKKKDRNYQYEFGAMSMLMNSNYIIVADKASKQIVCTNRSIKGEMEFEKGLYRINMDSILAFYDEPVMIGIQDDIEHYRVFQKKGAIKQVDLFINQKTSMLTRVEYGYREQQHVVIDFLEADTNPAFEPDTFEESRYVIKQKGNWKAVGAFAGFAVAMENK